MADLITIKNLELQARHGATADERKSTRRFQIDIEVRGDFARAVGSDRLNDTVDYHALCELAHSIGTSRTFHLLEALAGAVAAAILARHPLVAVEVEVRKLNPPCPGNPSYTAARISRP